MAQNLVEPKIYFHYIHKSCNIFVAMTNRLYWKPVRYRSFKLHFGGSLFVWLITARGSSTLLNRLLTQSYTRHPISHAFKPCSSIVQSDYKVIADWQPLGCFPHQSELSWEIKPGQSESPLQQAIKKATIFLFTCARWPVIDFSHFKRVSECPYSECGKMQNVKFSHASVEGKLKRKHSKPGWEFIQVYSSAAL